MGKKVQASLKNWVVNNLSAENIKINIFLQIWITLGNDQKE